MLIPYSFKHQKLLLGSFPLYLSNQDLVTKLHEAIPLAIIIETTIISLIPAYRRCQKGRRKITKRCVASWDHKATSCRYHDLFSSCREEIVISRTHLITTYKGCKGSKIDLFRCLYVLQGLRGVSKHLLLLRLLFMAEMYLFFGFQCFYSKLGIPRDPKSIIY